MDQRVKDFIDFAERNKLGYGFASYREAVDLGRTAEWWRNCAIHLFDTFREELREYDAGEPSVLPVLSDGEVNAAEHPEHEDRCGDS